MCLRLLPVLFLLSLPVAGQRALRQVVTDFAGSQVLRNAQVGVDVRDVTDGRQLAGHNAGRAMIPASTQKLLTTGVALDVLGPNHRFRTRLVAGGPVEDGVLRGNLYVVGGGDPTLGSSSMDGADDIEQVVAAWAAAVRARGITRIAGAVVGDGSYYGTAGTGRGWSWSDLGNYYGAGAYGLNLNENSYTLTFAQRPGEGTTPPILRTRPEIPGIVFRNELVSGPRGSGDQAYIFGAPFNYEQFVRGSIPAGTGSFSIRGSIPDPALLTAQLLDARLRTAGVTISGVPGTDRTLEAAPAGGQVLDERYSPYLSEIVDRTNMRSVNLYAEAILREINKQAGRSATDVSGTKGVEDWLKRHGIATDGVNLRDGSGLDARNFFPPEMMTAFLVARAKDERWIESIPLAGRSGSMRNVLRGTVAEGRVRGKSGTINAVRCYAGYVTRPDGRQLAFSIMVNNHTLRSSQVSTLIYGLMRDLCTAEL